MNDHQRAGGLALTTIAAGSRAISDDVVRARYESSITWQRAGEFNAVTTALITQPDSGDSPQ